MEVPFTPDVQAKLDQKRAAEAGCGFYVVLGDAANDFVEIG